MTAAFLVSRPRLRLAVSVPIIAAAVFVTMIALTIVMMVVPALSRTFETFGDRIEDTPVRLMGESAHILMFAGLVGVIAVSMLATAALLWRQRIATFLWPGRQFDGRQFALGFATLLVASAAWMAFDMRIGGAWRPPIFDGYYLLHTRLVYIGVMTAALLVGAAAEEVMFRGVLLRLTGLVTRHALVLCLINGLLFSAIHLDPDPSAFVARTLSGMAWTWAALRVGGVEFAVGGHFASNLFRALVATPFSDAIQVREADWVSLVPEALIALLVVVVVEWMMLRRDVPGGSVAEQAA